MSRSKTFGMTYIQPFFLIFLLVAILNYILQIGLSLRHKEVLPRSVIHCFTGTSIQAEKYISMGCFLGLTGEYFLDIFYSILKFLPVM